MKIILLIFVFSLAFYSCCNIPKGANKTRIYVDYSSWNLFSAKHKNAKKSIEAHLLGEDWLALTKENYQYKFWFEDFAIKSQENEYLITLKFQLRDLNDSSVDSKFETINFIINEALIQKSRNQAPPSFDISFLADDELVVSVLLGQRSVNILKDMLCKIY